MVDMHQIYLVVVPVTKHQKKMMVTFHLWSDPSSMSVYVILLVARRRCADSDQKRDKDVAFHYKKC